mmetsp:Transcript_7906/g.19515  ORF Transcript_7906/g.19515 Transcript_7906/m.19515 type:complete len:115 (+) Transcript_7906:311-655(+)
MARREERALENMQTAIDMHEIIERISIRSHKSFLPHGAVFKVSRDILTVADLWAVCTSPLELQNADTKRVADHSSSRRPTTSRNYGTSTAISTLQHLLGTAYLRRGELGVVEDG